MTLTATSVPVRMCQATCFLTKVPWPMALCLMTNMGVLIGRADCKVIRHGDVLTTLTILSMLTMLTNYANK